MAAAMMDVMFVHGGVMELQAAGGVKVVGRELPPLARTFCPRSSRTCRRRRT